LVVDINRRAGPYGVNYKAVHFADFERAGPGPVIKWLQLKKEQLLTKAPANHNFLRLQVAERARQQDNVTG
jgi:hypothetical protein